MIVAALDRVVFLGKRLVALMANHDTLFGFALGFALISGLNLPSC
jgi:hypothetical protein